MKLQTSMKAGLLATSLLLVPALSQAQSVPSLNNGEQLPPVHLISPDRVFLDDKEAHGVALAEEWKSHPDRPRRGEDGSVRYLYGATMPSLICTPLEVCAIRLEAGEVVNDVHAGDTARWRITPATTGSGRSAATLVIVKPTDAGLSTNLFISTDRRTYTIRLISSQDEWIPLLSFDYPEDLQAEFAAHQRAQAEFSHQTTMPSGQSIMDLDFDFRVSGDRPSWAPVRVYTDGEKTYIQFPSANFNHEAPALVTLGPSAGWFSGPSEEMVNYRVIGDKYVVDQVIDKAALITGVGSQQTRVVIERGR